jgi:CheY-like chemotaxis protein
MLILVVDDDDLVRRVVAEFLDDLGFSVLEVTSASEALVLIRDRIELDLVITDVNMPEMDGMQLVEELKSMRPSLPVILMSGRPQKDHNPEFPRQAVQPEAASFVHRPCNGTAGWSGDALHRAAMMRRRWGRH